MFTYDDIVSQRLLQNSFYDIDQDTEKLCLEYLPTNFSNTIKVKKIFENETYSLLLNLFELDTTDNKVPFYDLKKLLFIKKETNEINELDLDDIDFNITNTKKFIEEYLKYYNRLTKAYPIVNIIFSKICTILRYLLCKDYIYNGIYKVDYDTAATTYTKLYNDINYILNNREKMKQELLDIFHLFAEYKVKLPTSEVALIYQAYNQYQKNDLIFNELNPYIRNKGNDTLDSWKDIINTLPSKLNAPLEFPVCDSLTKFTMQMVQLLIHNEQSIRKCKNCNRYFVVKYSSLAEYCSRNVDGTSSTCQEYASKKTYKKKQVENPLYQVFTTYYNRIYGRIRRGNLDKDTTLLDDIKSFHQKYAIKYNNISDKSAKTKLIQEFISLAENLIK